MNPVDGILRSSCLLGKNLFICQTTGKTVKGILREKGTWKVKLETAEGHPEYHSLACPWDSTHTLEVKHCGSQATLACKGCGGMWLAIIEKDSRLEYYPKSATADFIEEGEIRILESEQVNFVKDAHVNMMTEKQSQPSLVESLESVRRKIQDRIELGYQLRDQPIYSEDELEKVREKCRKWAESNRVLSSHLSRLFNDLSIVDKCRSFSDHTPPPIMPSMAPTLPELIDKYQKRMTPRITELEGLLEAINLNLKLPENIHLGSSLDPTFTQKIEVFIVHGRDLDTAEVIARTVEKLGIEAIILHEKPDEGRTIIEKLEALAENASFAIVLFTPDDVGTLKDKVDDKGNPRARQNVIFELGYFIGKLGRKRVRIIYKGEVESPSDIDGILYIRMDECGAWRQKLAQEMASAGLPIAISAIL